MKLQDLIEKLDLTIKADAGNLAQTVDNCYVSDLLSNVMGQATAGSLWVTMQGHQNIAAVASLLSLPAIIVAGDAQIDGDSLNKAAENGVSVLASPLATFELAGRLYAEGLRGTVK